MRWGGHGLDRVGGPSKGGPRLLHFSDDTTVETDLVIGADGAFSRVRPAISPAVPPEYSGISFLEAWFSDVEARHPDIAELVGQGGAHAADGERGLFAQRNSDDRVRVYLIQRVPADWIVASGLTAADTDAIRALLLERYARWSPPYAPDDQQQRGPLCGSPDLRAARAAPLGAQSDGDPARRRRPPHAALGVGVNLAMLDASDLALALAGAATVDDAVHTYEKTMLARSAEMSLALEGGAEHLLATTFPPDFSDDEPLR